LGDRHFSALEARAYFLLLRQKKVAKEKATPGSAPFGVLALLGRPGGCGTRATPSNSPRRLPPARLRCSAPLMGAPKASGLYRSAPKTDSHGQPEKTAKNEICRTPSLPLHPSLPRRWESMPLRDSRLRRNDRATACPRGGLPAPLRGAEQRRVWRIKGEDCLRAQPEFRSPRQSRVAQGTGAAGTDPGSPSSLATFFLAKQEESTPAPQARKTPLTKGRRYLTSGTSDLTKPLCKEQRAC
jgi:hypothetical protein